ncbi:hypothetical protein BGZ63DRAFT_323377, partial [Mariannaea sp. PMI_226]
TNEETGHQAHLRAKVANSSRVLNFNRMQDLVASLDCSSENQVVLKFKNETSLQTTQSHWRWVSDAPENTLYFVVDGEECGGEHGREQYAITHVAFDTPALTATLTGPATPWASLLDDVTLRMKSTSGGPGLDKRWSDKGSFSIAHDFSRNIFNKTVDGVTFAIQCANCKTTGGFEYDISLGGTNQASFTTTNGLGASLGLGVSASGGLTTNLDRYSLNLLTIPLGGIHIPHLVDLGPEVTIDAVAAIKTISGKIEADMGVAMTIPDGTTLRVGGGSSDDIKPQFNLIGPSISASASIKVSVGPVITLDIDAKLAGFPGYVLGVAINAPEIDATLSAAASTAGKACDNSLAGIDLSITAQADVNIFYGKGSAGQEPNSIHIFGTGAT